jgi:hypothetical protein
MTNGTHDAFPTLVNGDDVHGEPGLTKREYFAAMAMQGIIASNDETFAQIAVNYNVPVTQITAEVAVGFADGLIEALNK